MGFRDRADAGRKLGQQLLGARQLIEPCIVLALPRGGVEVGFEVARTLHCPLDVIPARKLGAPIQPELAIGAIAPGAAVINEEVVRQLGVSQGEIESVVREEQREMNRRAMLFRSGRPPLNVTGKTVILVDDGLATGATAAAAIQSVSHAGARGLILAVPVGARETVRRLSPAVDEVVVLESPDDFRAVGQYYEDFEQTSDERVIELLEQAAVARAG